MIDMIAQSFRWLVVGVLAAFAVRRIVYLVASLWPYRATPLNAARSITMLVAARNEADNLPALLQALGRLDYPAPLLRLVLVSDGSTDETPAIMHGAQRMPFPVSVLELPEPRGKGGALAAGYASSSDADLIVVFDADCEPATDVLQRLAGAFDDPRIGAATAYPRPGNPTASLISRYAALERWVHHLVVLAAKDQLRMDPPIIGVAFAVRRTALVEAGGFPTDRLAEDLELSWALTAAGWRTRWLGDAVVRENVVETREAFLRQRTRWSRGMLHSARRIRSVEDLLTAAGYLDRAAWLVAVLFVPLGLLSWWWPAVYLVMPGLMVLRALRRAEAGAIWPYLIAATTTFGTDLRVSIVALLGLVRRNVFHWDRGP